MIEDLELVDVDDIKVGKGGGGIKNKGKMYTKYADALKGIIPFLKDEIEKRETIRVIAKDIHKEMGREFEKKSSTALLWGIRFTLFKEGIFLSMGRHQSGEDVYIMKAVGPDDKLPDGLSDKLEKEKETENHHEQMGTLLGKKTIA